MELPQILLQLSGHLINNFPCVMILLITIFSVLVQLITLSTSKLYFSFKISNSLVEEMVEPVDFFDFFERYK